MENTKSSSLLPTIKCSNCAADIQISSITDHVCSVNGYLTPIEYTPISNMMSGQILPGTAFLQIGPQTPSSNSSSPASPDHLPFSNKTKYISNSLSMSLTPPESLSPKKDSMNSVFPSPRDVYLRLKSIEEHERKMSKTQSKIDSHSESNQMDAVINPKSTDNSGFFLKVDKIAPGPFDVNRKRDLLNNIEHDVYRKTNVDNLNDTKTRKASYDKADVYLPSARGHFYKNSSGSISSKTNYAILPKVPRKNGYDGFGPPNSDNNGATKLRSSSHSQNFSLNDQSSLLLSLNSNLDLETKIKSLVDDVVRKDETPDFSESIFDSVSMLPQELNDKKKENLSPISPLNITDGMSWSPPLINLDNSPIVMPKIKLDNLPPIPQLSPVPPKDDINLPSSLPQKSSNKPPFVVPKIKLENLPPLPPLPPLSPLSSKEDIKLPPLMPSKELNKPSSLLHKITTNRLPPLPQLRTIPLRENIDKLQPFPPKSPDNLPSQLQQSKILPLPPKESNDESSSSLAQQNPEKKLLENYIEEKTQFLSLERSNKNFDINESHIFGLSNPNTSLEHNRKRSDVSQLENLMADIESSISDLDLNERPSTRSSSHSSTQISPATTYKSVNESNNNQQNSNALSSTSTSIGVPKILSPIKNSSNRPNFPQQNMFPTNSTDISPADRVVQSGLSSDRSPRSQTRSPYQKPRSSKGKCKGCGEDIYGKSVSSADGRLTGRYHKECFVCKICQKPFKTASCYVINDAPYCEAHYHKINGSNCFTCKKGIEGKYIETDRGQKHHPNCLRCSDCKCVLQNKYFEMDGLLYCENDAYQRAKQKHYPNSNVDGKSSQVERGPKRLVMT